LSNLNSIEIKELYSELVRLGEGDFCPLCCKTLTELGVDKLELHEIRYRRPLYIKNFRLLCHGCNHKLELRKKTIEKYSSITAEHKKADAAYPLFIRWLEGEILKPENNNHLPYDRTISQAAYEIGMKLTNYPLSTETIKRYLDPLCDHPTSPYVTRADNNNQFEIWVRNKEPEND